MLDSSKPDSSSPPLCIVAALCSAYSSLSSSGKPHLFIFKALAVTIFATTVINVVIQVFAVIFDAIVVALHMFDDFGFIAIIAEALSVVIIGFVALLSSW